ncbi:MAG TPA: lycopene beta-cyclase CrtY [Polyangiaceae bacterium]|nr:lycopene beta-cyclase CrtY [Polyangiaceae bacterium]
MARFDYLLVGGGLQNSLLCCAIAALQPKARVALVERGTVGGNHTWCFQATDVDRDMLAVATPLIEHTWSGYDVAFPSRERRLEGDYHCVTSERLRAVVSALFDARPELELHLGHSATRVFADRVELSNGTCLYGRAVIDARGPSLLPTTDIAGYQKFLGLEVELEQPHGIARPLLMDARVEQLDGYRFVYVLPFGARRVLVEDTYFSEHSRLDASALRARLLDYLRTRGLRVAHVVREETGTLPLPGRMAPPRGEPPLTAGYQGGWFHPTTGYSFPLAARLAHAVARLSPDALFGPELMNLIREQGRQLRFATLLNRLMFSGFEPEARWNVFERFYGLPNATIARFYALATTPFDRARILCGRPPRGISLRRAVTREMNS